MNATVHQASAAEDGTVFKHRPLDHSKLSIRLVHLLPFLSPKGHMQCSITHATVDAIYTCLPYRWGGPQPSHAITIDGKNFIIGQNLFDFLAAAREKAASDGCAALGPYWIDALCIDQSNVLERNHQVLQMGTIYTQAVTVNVWLGPANSDLLTVLPIIQKAKSNDVEWRTFINCKDILIQHVSNNLYWTRAWIVQEIALAKQVIIWLGTTSIDLEVMHQWLDFLWDQDPIIRSSPFSQLAIVWQEGFQKHGSLVQLIDYFREKECLDPRDRVFSLLSLVTGDGRELKADYNVSQGKLAAEILHQCKSTLCLYTAILVAQTLNLDKVDIDGPKLDRRSIPCLEFCVEDILVSFNFRQNREKGVSPWQGWVDSGLSFQETCKAGALFPHKLNPYLIYLDDSGLLHQKPTQKDDITFRPAEGWEDIYIVRILLSFLTKIMNHPVRVCSNAKYGWGSDAIPAGYPRICYAADSLRQPGTAELSSFVRRPPPRPPTASVVKTKRPSVLKSVWKKYWVRESTIPERIRRALAENEEWLYWTSNDNDA
jgi:hypothetical protein